MYLFENEDVYELQTLSVLSLMSCLAEQASH